MVETPPLRNCERCDAPFEARMIHLGAPGRDASAATFSIPATICPECEKSGSREAVLEFAAARRVPGEPNIPRPIPQPDVTVACMQCGRSFTTEAVLFKGDGRRIKDVVSHATVCEECTAQATPAPKPPTLDETERRRIQWVNMTGIRYADFHENQLPAVIRPLAPRVLSWTVQPKGVGLVGESRTGKSPLLYALGQSLFVGGADVFPTSGIEFQRKFHRAIEHRDEWGRYLKACEDSEVLLMDDADKLNLTAGVEAEYYGMLETRRNWQRPILCTLNLSGAEFSALGRDRNDRAAAIVERLRDLCEFIAVEVRT